MGMADHFVNNTIVNLFHIESTTGTDEMYVFKDYCGTDHVISYSTFYFFGKEKSWEERDY